MTGEPRSADASAARGAPSASVERTQLSWMRSGLSVAAVSTLLVKHAVGVGGGWTGVAVGLAVLAAGVAVATVPVGRHLRSEGNPAYSTGAIRATATICTGIGVVALVVLLLPVRG